MSVRMAGPIEVEALEERRLLSGVADAVAWDLKTPISGELSRVGEVDYFRFTASAGEKIVFDSTEMKGISILDSDGKTELDRLLILDGDLAEPTPGRLVWEAPHTGTFYVSVAGYTAFLIDVPTGPYTLAAYAVDDSLRPEDGPMIGAGQTVIGNLSSAGDVDYYSFDAKAGVIYRFAVTSEKLPEQAFVSAHYVMGVEEARPWTAASPQPEDAREAYPGHNLQFLNLDGQKGLVSFAEWIAPASGRYHFSIAPLDAAHVGAYTMAMSARASACDPQDGGDTGIGVPLPMPPNVTSSEVKTTSQHTQPKSSSRSARHQKPRKHHRRPAVGKHEKPAAKENRQSARQKLLLPGRD